MATLKRKDPVHLTPEEYLARERASVDKKHEFVDGEIVAMVGASLAHNLIKENIARRLGVSLEGSGCKVVSSDMRVKAGNSYYYPDVLVYCGSPAFSDEEGDVLTNPRVVVEVLSESTEVRDRSEKFFWYQRLESLSDYLLVAQDQARIEYRSRYATERWFLDILDGTAAVLDLPSVGCALSLADVYQGVWDR